MLSSNFVLDVKASVALYNSFLYLIKSPYAKYVDAVQSFTLDVLDTLSNFIVVSKLLLVLLTNLGDTLISVPLPVTVLLPIVTLTVPEIAVNGSVGGVNSPVYADAPLTTRHSPMYPLNPYTLHEQSLKRTPWQWLRNHFE